MLRRATGYYADACWLYTYDYFCYILMIIFVLPLSKTELLSSGNLWWAAKNFFDCLGNWYTTGSHWTLNELLVTVLEIDTKLSDYYRILASAAENYVSYLCDSKCYRTTSRNSKETTNMLTRRKHFDYKLFKNMLIACFKIMHLTRKAAINNQGI